MTSKQAKAPPGEAGDWNATRVVELRRRLGLTLQQFAVRLGVHAGTVTKWEGGRAVPSPLAAEKLDALLGGEGRL